MLPFAAVSVFKEEPPTHLHVRNTILVGLVLVLVVVLSAAFYHFRGGPEPVRPEAPPAAVPSPAPAPPPKAGSNDTGAPAAPVREAPDAPRRRAAAPTPAEPVAEAPRADAATLVVESDVPGASVFVDREFVGQAPVTLKNLAPGSKRINLSAEGYEGISREVEVAAGESTVTMRFKEVRLDAAVPVSHKHGMGQCDGTLRATPAGLSYQTSNKGDAFSLPYDQLATFEINYLEKNLRVKQKGGKTWNFTDKQAENADALFVFHRDVTLAREKLAKGYTAVR